MNVALGWECRCLLVCIMLLLLGVCACRPRRTEDFTRGAIASKAEHQMRLLAMAIQDKVIAGETNIGNVLYVIAKAHGAGILQLEGRSNVCFNINPNSALWQPGASQKSDIGIYVKLDDPEGAAVYYRGINFYGQTVPLTVPPDWSGVAVQHVR